jgi:hypothetical protein
VQVAGADRHTFGCDGHRFLAISDSAVRQAALTERDLHRLAAQIGQ